MKASIRPLSGKYYGTIVDIECGGINTELKIWHSNDNGKVDITPSSRQLKEWGFATIKEATNNDLPCHPHYENITDLNIASQVVHAINQLNVDYRDIRKFFEGFAYKPQQV